MTRRAGQSHWTKVRKKNRSRSQKESDKRQVTHKRNRGEALIIKIEASEYSEVLKVMCGDAKLADLGADVRSIRRTRTGEMILELNKTTELKGPEYRDLR